MTKPSNPVATSFASERLSAPLPSSSPRHGTRTRVAFITGAARGIGLAIACRLAKDGLDIAINDVNPETLAEALVRVNEAGGNREVGQFKAISVLGDVSNEEDAERMVGEVVQGLGYLDVMVANAGIVMVKPFMDVTSADVDRVFSINVRGVHLCYKYAAQQFIKQGTGGKLIAAASVAAFQQMRLLSTYSATKFAVRGINQGAALELAPYGITANAYCPGIVGTDMWELIDKKIHETDGTAVGASFGKYGNIIPLGRTSVADDIAGVVSFLAGKDSDYMTGQSIIVDGGIRMS